MRQVVALISLLAVISGGSVFAAGHSRALAQNATPRGDTTTPIPAVEFLAFAVSSDLASPGELMVFRLHFEPGTALPLARDESISGLVIVESGALAIEADAAG